MGDGTDRRATSAMGVAVVRACGDIVCLASGAGAAVGRAGVVAPRIFSVRLATFEAAATKELGWYKH